MEKKLNIISRNDESYGEFIKNCSQFKINGVVSSDDTYKNFIFTKCVVNYNLKINEAIKTIFGNNDFNFRRDIIAYNLAHLKVWKNNNNLNKPIIIVDESVKLCENFGEKLEKITKELNEQEYDILILNSQNQVDIQSTPDDEDYSCCQKYNITSNDICAYIITQSGIDKIFEYIGNYTFNKVINELMNNIEDLVVMETNMKIVDILFENEENDPVHELEGYTFYSCLDLPGYDIEFCENKSIEEIKAICDNNDNYMAFNTIGWIKYKQANIDNLEFLYGSSTYCDGIYVKNIDHIVEKKVDYINKGVIAKTISNNIARSNLTFTITSCKRWYLFKQTMDSFLLNCKDAHIIDEWICIDDNSSEEDRMLMRERYPFFKFFMKGSGNKGHPKSMNILWDLVNTDYIIHFEDDWHCNKPFHIEYVLEYLKQSNNVGQVILKKLPRNDDHIFIQQIDDKNLYKYIYNPTHFDKPEDNKIYDLHIVKDFETYKDDEYYWWPGFTLNPAITNLSKIKNKVGYFSENVKLDLFEYDYAVRCAINNIEINYIEMEIEHIGWKCDGVISAYSLNNTKRSYDD